MKNSHFIIAILVGLLLMTIGACLPSKATDKKDSPTQLSSSFLTRAIDTEAGVVCYRFGAAEGIDCFLINQTNLKVKE